MSDFKHPSEEFRFKFGGIKLNSAPDNLPPDKYAMAINVRAVNDSSVQTRPGQTLKFGCSTSPVTDMRAYDVLGTDNAPRIIARDSSDRLWLDVGSTVGSNFGDLNHSGAGLGAFMIPFRPNQSPNSYLYVANGADYQKFSAPDSLDHVVQTKVGIAEPQQAPDVAINAQRVSLVSANPGWVQAGTAAAAANGTRLSDACGAVFQDPSTVPFAVILPPTPVYSVQVGSSLSYQKLMAITSNGVNYIVHDIFPPLASPIGIASIFYFSGTTGQCIIVPQTSSWEIPATGGTPIGEQNLLAALRRGAILQVGTELCIIWSVTVGVDGTIAIETSTVNTHTAAETLTSVPAIQVVGAAPIPGQAITAADVLYQVTTGVGTQGAALSAATFLSGGVSFQTDDYISIGLFIDNPANLTEFRILFDVGDGSFTQNYYYYAVRASDLAAAVAGTQTQLAAAQIAQQRRVISRPRRQRAAPPGSRLALDLDVNDRDLGNDTVTTDSPAGSQTVPGANQWTQITFPVSALTRVGSDQSKSLLSVTKVQLSWNVLNTVSVGTSAITVIGGYAPNVGEAGVPYMYRIRQRSRTTGAKGNPSPATRYGVKAYRESIRLVMPFISDLQIDTWDVFRYGGSVTSWRYIGSAPAYQLPLPPVPPSFIDNFDDAAAQAGDVLEFDNFEPWPSIDVPQNLVASVTGTTALVTVASPTNILRYLPGTLVQINGVSTYTLRIRPTLISGTTYLLQFEENAGVQVGATLSITEPPLANQMLPYMWGPDATGTIFACGDPLRPGTVYFAKNYDPDSAPDAYNIEISPPSEPLLGGEVVDGLCFVASPERWWALIPTPDNPAQRYAIRQESVDRGLAAPYGHCNDGVQIFYWAKDGIRGTQKGSLTDADLYNLFPHEGVVGQDVTYNNNTVHAPDYSRAGTFRLEYSNYYLYATYQDSSGTYRNLVYDLRRDAWSVDSYATAVSVFYHPEQPAGTLLTSTARYDETLMGNVAGKVARQTVNTNDMGVGISGVLATAEWDGNDVRRSCQWGDIFIDSVPAAAAIVLKVTPMSLGAQVGSFTNLTKSAVRVRQPISVGDIVVSDFMGIQLDWKDDFTQQSVPTQLHVWQPSYVLQPAFAIEWFTFGTSFGVTGYMHVRQIALAYLSSAPIILEVSTVDGQSPQNITIPSSGGQYTKKLFPLTANKGMLYNFHASSAQPFQIFLSDCEIYVGAWARNGGYMISRSFEADDGAEAVV